MLDIKIAICYKILKNSQIENYFISSIFEKKDFYG
jgi:hypothetical protein